LRIARPLSQGPTHNEENNTMANVPPAKRIPKKKSNPLRSGQNIDYKDIATLRKFISERGKIRARRVTGLSVQEQRRVAIAIKNAREVALLPYASTAR
jgi:small subunit ribosomal protein S18